MDAEEMKEAVLEACADVEDPELQLGLVDLEAELLLVQLETGDVPIEELSARQEELNL